jgi:hypothetical protein
MEMASMPVVGVPASPERGPSRPQSAAQGVGFYGSYNIFRVFERIPIPDQYFESKPEAQKLIGSTSYLPIRFMLVMLLDLAPPFILRLSFLVDIFIAGAVSDTLISLDLLGLSVHNICLLIW